jgi:hypothetical protein
MDCSGKIPLNPPFPKGGELHFRKRRNPKKKGRRIKIRRGDSSSFNGRTQGSIHKKEGALKPPLK